MSPDALARAIKRTVSTFRWGALVKKAVAERDDGDLPELEDINFSGMAELIQMARRRIDGMTADRVARIGGGGCEGFDDMMEQATAHLTAALMEVARAMVAADKRNPRRIEVQPEGDNAN